MRRYRFIVDNFMVDRGFPPWHGVPMEQIGDLFKQLPEVRSPMVKVEAAKILPAPTRKPKPTPTHQSDNLLHGALAIAEAPDKIERAYMARQLVQCTLPHSNPGNVEGVSSGYL
jgi:hypothetical protein